MESPAVHSIEALVVIRRESRPLPTLLQQPLMATSEDLQQIEGCFEFLFVIVLIVILYEQFFTGQ